MDRFAVHDTGGVALDQARHGGTVAGLRFCEEGLNDSGQLAFVAEIEDRNGDVRVAVFRATRTK